MNSTVTSTLDRFKGLSTKMFATAMEDGIEQMRGLCKTTSGANLRALDLGCWDGTNTLRISPNVQVIGTEVNAAAGGRARDAGIDVACSDLDAGLPFRSASFDLVFSNQVIEHVFDTDLFVSETFRVLRPGGMAVVSTENMSSWHNIAALVLGWQAFSMTNVSQQAAGLGNPLATHRSADLAGPDTDTGWQHRRVFAYRGLRELFSVHGFRDVRVHANGYYPLPSRFARIDPRHGAFLTVQAWRPAE